MTDYSLRSAIYDVYVYEAEYFWKGANGTPDINEWWNMENEDVNRREGLGWK